MNGQWSVFRLARHDVPFCSQGVWYLSLARMRNMSRKRVKGRYVSSRNGVYSMRQNYMDCHELRRAFKGHYGCAKREWHLHSECFLPVY